MATSVRLSRQPGQPWGFRIHGGSDFSQPLIIVKVTAGSIAAQNGLGPGDQFIQINGKDALRMKHKEAQDLILGAGTTLDLQVARAGSSTWKPQVQVLGEANRAPAGAPVPQVTKTSLAKTPAAPAAPINPQINSQAKPFSIVNQTGDVLVNNQYNTPINLYSEQSIAETLSAQSEVLAGGAIGVNFKKNEKKYNHENSEVYKMLQQVESEEGPTGRTPPPLSPKSNVQVMPVTIPPVQLRSVAPKPAAPPAAAANFSPVAAPTAPAPVQAPAAPAPSAPSQSAPASGGNPNVCAECERLIVGVFVRIKDKNLHVECFKCNTCGQSLKNIGYYNINNKLYCDVHAKTVARANPPAPGMEPLPTIPSQTSGLPSGTVPLAPLTNPILGSPGRPSSYGPVTPPKPFGKPQSPGVVAPIPFHHSPTTGISHVTAPRSPVSRPNYTQQQQQSQFQQQQIQQPGGGLLQQYSSSSSFQQSSFSSSSTTQTNQSSTGGSGLRVAWPPSPSEAAASAGGDLPQATPPISAIPQTQSLLQQAPLPSAPQPITSFGQSLGQQQQFKPVAPPKFQQKQVPYKPLSTLLQPAGRPAPPPSAAPAPSSAQASKLIQQSIPPMNTTPAHAAAPAPAPRPAMPAPVPTAAAPSPPGAATGAGPGGKGAKTLSILPKRGRGVLTQPGGPRVAICSACQSQIRGPFITANSKFYCPDHFKCATPNCSRPLMDVGFVEEKGQLHCEYCWESHLAPQCGRCRNRIKYECLNAIGQSFHPECFACRHCNKPFGNNPFFLEDGEPYCDADWNELFTTKCYGCGFPIEAGDRWVEAIGQNYHSQCFNCAACKKNLEGQSFFAKAGRPFCKSHAR